MILYIFFHDLIHIYSPCAGGIQLPGDKVLMSTETSCHFGHLLLVSNHRPQQFLKNPLFYLFPIQSRKDQIWLCRKIGQGQLKVIFWTNLVVLEYPMLHTIFQGYRPFGSGEEDFFTIYRRGGHLSHVTCLNKLSFPHSMEAPYEIWLWVAKQFLRRRCLKSVDDDGRRTDNGVYLCYKLTYEPKGSGELKTLQSGLITNFSKQSP